MLALVPLTVTLPGCSGHPADVAPPATDVQQRTVDGLILLTHPTDSPSDLASLVGELRADASNCITVDGAVVVLPDEDDVLGDGSLRRAGRTYAPGDVVRVVGGFSPATAAMRSACGPGDYFFAGSAS